MHPKFSIIIPVYNAEQFLTTCIESIKAQTLSDFEAIFVDDGSTDNSYNIIQKSFENENFDVTIIKQENKGVSASRNKALLKAKGEYIFFLDSDDKLPNNALEILQTKIHEFPQVDFILGNHITMDPLGNYYSRSLYFEKRKKYANTILDWGKWMEYIVAGHGNIWGYLLKNDLIKQLNLKFNEKVTIAEDLLFLMKYITGRKGIFIEENTYIYRYARTNSLSNTRTKNEKDITSCIEFLKEATRIAHTAQNLTSNSFQKGLEISTNYMTRRCLGIIPYQPYNKRVILIKELKKLKASLPIKQQSFSERIIRILYNYFPYIFVCIKK